MSVSMLLSVVVCDVVVMGREIVAAMFTMLQSSRKKGYTWSRQAPIKQQRMH